ncbi:hypothetical protein [Chromobacterium sp. ASV23]|nr:hypothetical protein [Chromobacterium sp. ASV23]
MNASIEQCIRHLSALCRGPMAIENGLCLCPLQDPWDKLIGLRGPSSSTG